MKLTGYPFNNMKNFEEYCFKMDLKLKLFGNDSGDCPICGTNYRILYDSFKIASDEIIRLRKLCFKFAKQAKRSK